MLRLPSSSSGGSSEVGGKLVGRAGARSKVARKRHAAGGPQTRSDEYARSRGEARGAGSDARNPRPSESSSAARCGGVLPAKGDLEVLRETKR